VGHQLFQLVFGAVGGKVCDLRLEGHDQVGRRVNDGGTEIVDARRVVAPVVRETRGLGVQAHAQHGAVLVLCGTQHVGEVHAPDCRQGLFFW